MAPLKIVPAFGEQRISHGDVCAKALKDHTQYELVLLAIQARNSNNAALLQCFEVLPTLVELHAAKVEIEQAAMQVESDKKADAKAADKNKK